MKVIVLGASGQIGSLIFEGLKTNYEVVGTSRKPSRKFIQFDPFYDNWSALGTADVLINCVGQIEATQSRSFYHIHVDLTKRIIQNREVLGNPRLIQISALGASVNHKVEFLRTKGIADELLLQHFNTAVVRPSIVCTPRTMIIRKIRMLFRVATYTAGLVFVPAGFLATRLQPVMPQDLIDVIHYLSTERSQKLVNVVGPEPISFGYLVSAMFETRKRKFKIIEIPKFLSDMLIKYGLSIVFPGVINSQQYQLLFEDNVADANEVRTMLGKALTSPKPFFIKELSYATD